MTVAHCFFVAARSRQPDKHLVSNTKLLLLTSPESRATFRAECSRGTQKKKGFFEDTLARGRKICTTHGSAYARPAETRRERCKFFFLPFFSVTPRNVQARRCFPSSLFLKLRLSPSEPSRNSSNPASSWLRRITMEKSEVEQRTNAVALYRSVCGVERFFYLNISNRENLSRTFVKRSLDFLKARRTHTLFLS